MANREKGTGSWDIVVKNGIKYYRYRKKYDGMKSYKEFYGRTKSDVKRKIAEFESKTLHVTSKDYRTMTLEECMSNVMDNLKMTMKDSNYATLMSTYRCYILTNDIKDIQMGNIDKKVIQDYYFKMAESYSESTVKKTRTLFNAVFNYLVNANIITENPASGIQMPHKSKYAVKKKEHAFMSLDDAEKFYETCFMKADSTYAGIKTGEYIYGRNAHFCTIILYTGMRIGEAYALTWKDVDFKNGIITINKTKENIKINNKYEWKVDTTKRESSNRVIPLANRARKSFEYLKLISPNAKDTDEIFLTANGRTPSQSTLTRSLHAIMKRAGLNPEGFGLHDLRHSFGSMLLEKGWKENKPVDIKVISELLGHKDVSTTYNIYLHILQSHKAEVINLLD